MESIWTITLPTPAVVLLLACTIVFAVLAQTEKSKAKKTQINLDLSEARIREARRLAADDGLITGLKRGYAEMYLAVVKAHRAGRDPIVAAARVAEMNAGFLLGERAEVADDRAIVHGGIPSNHE